MIHALVDAGVSLTAKWRGQSALHWAAEGGHVSTIQALQSCGESDLERGTEDGETAAMLAASKGRLEVVQFLHRAGCDLDRADNEGDTAGILAAENGHVEVVQFLHRAGCDLDKASNSVRTAGISAALYGHLEVVQFLHRAGCDFEKADNSEELQEFRRPCTAIWRSCNSFTGPDVTWTKPTTVEQLQEFLRPSTAIWRSCNFFTGPDVTWTEPTTRVTLLNSCGRKRHVEWCNFYTGPDVTLTKPTTLVTLLEFGRPLTAIWKSCNFFKGPDVTLRKPPTMVTLLEFWRPSAAIWRSCNFFTVRVATSGTFLACSRRRRSLDGRGISAWFVDVNAAGIGKVRALDIARAKDPNGPVTEALLLAGASPGPEPQLVGFTALKPSEKPPHGYVWFTCGAPNLAQSRGKFYHEIQILSEFDCPQLGWLSTDFKGGDDDGKGVGDDSNGWAFDGQRCCCWHGGEGNRCRSHRGMSTTSSALPSTWTRGRCSCALRSKN